MMTSKSSSSSADSLADLMEQSMLQNNNNTNIEGKDEKNLNEEEELRRRITVNAKKVTEISSIIPILELKKNQRMKDFLSGDDSSVVQNNNNNTNSNTNGRVLKRRKMVKLTTTENSTDNKKNNNDSAAFVFGHCVRCGKRQRREQDYVVDDDVVCSCYSNNDDLMENKQQRKTTAVRYLHEGLEVSDGLLERAKEEEKIAAMKEGKIFLVLDLDHTLLNSCRFDELEESERNELDERIAKRDEEDEEEDSVTIERKNDDDELQNKQQERPRFPDLHCLRHFSTYTKLRPFVFEFLEEASKICRMHLYTMGDKHYAHEMANLIDPEGKYFHGRIIGNSDSTCSKTKDLDIVLGGDDCTLIVDDTSRVWPRHARNLIRVDRYHFYRKSATTFREAPNSSVMERGIDEGVRADDGGIVKHREVLKDVLAVLKLAHRMAFRERETGDEEHKDVRDVFSNANGSGTVLSNSPFFVLKDCVILPSGITPSKDVRPERHPLLLLAAGLGAKIVNAMSDDVTHVLAGADNTEKVRKGRNLGKHVVNGNWLRECALQNVRLDESDFIAL
jgi:RNA polymerase II C-terminal domain phosphatase-like 3/4